MAPRIKNAHYEDKKGNGDLEDGHAGFSEMAPLINNTSDESNTKNRSEHVDHVVVPKEGSAFESAGVG
jgi:hypothetical protein